MYRLVSTYIALFMALGVYSQTRYNLIAPQSDSIYTSSIQYHGEFIAGSNGLNNEMIHPFLFGGHISDESIQNGLSKLNEKNQFGIDAMNSIQANISLDSLKQKQLIVRISSKQHNQISYSKTVAQLAFLGNEQFIGERTNMNGAFERQINYNQLGFGIQMNTIENWTFSGILNLNMGTRFEQIDLPYLQLETANQARYLQLDVNGDYSRNDTNSTSLNWFSTGASVDLAAQYMLKREGKEPVIFEFQALDLGFLTWNDQSINYSADTSIRYTGFQLGELFSTDLRFEDISPDSILDEVEENATQSRRTSPLSSWLTFSAQTSWNQWTAEAGIHARLFTESIPFVYWQQSYAFTNRFAAHALLGYGGYQTLHVGLGLNFHYKRFQFTLGSQNIEGLLFPAEFGNNNGYFSACVRF